LTSSKKKPALKEYYVSVRMNVELSIRVLAATPEEALAKGRDLEGSYDRFLDESQYDDLNDGSAEIVGVWTID
jgi:hypothetical protein